MRIPPFERYEKTFVGLGIFIVGMIVGSAIFMAIYQNNFSLLSIQNQHMRTEIESLKTTNKNLSLKQNRVAPSAIRSIAVIFEAKNDAAKLDEISENELRKKIVQDLQFLNGKAIAKLKEDPLLYRNLIDGKTYHAIGERDYVVYVRTFMVIESNLILTVNPTLLRR
ncbi:MAG: hypothetical protein JWM44_3970 [Bacilli bacterium]|nr:hypothetical protein [Bacilli bacterium]